VTRRNARTAASNSVDWYESMFRAHGLAGEVADGMWTCRGVAPPYYSNAVTLSPTPADAQTETLRVLASALRGTFTVKDSFAALDLAPLGMRPLFDAEWIRRDPSAPPPPSTVVDARWVCATSAPELARWETAWRNHGSPTTSPVFVPTLLSDAAVAVFAALRGDAVVGGFVANRSEDVVGLTNFFAGAADADALAASAIGEIARFAPGAQIVGYERGAELDRAKANGFSAVGPLRVWRRDVAGT
jgi:hypothetical protein